MSMWTPSLLTSALVLTGCTLCRDNFSGKQGYLTPGEEHSTGLAATIDEDHRVELDYHVTITSGPRAEPCRVAVYEFRDEPEGHAVPPLGLAEEPPATLEGGGKLVDDVVMPARDTDMEHAFPFHHLFDGHGPVTRFIVIASCIEADINYDLDMSFQRCRATNAEEDFEHGIDELW